MARRTSEALWRWLGASARGANGSDGRVRANFNTVGAGVCILLGAAILLLIPTQVERPPTLFGVEPSGLDPALFPTLVAIAFVIVGLIYLRESYRMVERNLFRDLDRAALFNVGSTIVVSLIYATLLVPLGFILASALTVATLSVSYGSRNPLALVLVAIGVPTGIYYLFTEVLLVALPALPAF